MYTCHDNSNSNTIYYYTFSLVQHYNITMQICATPHHLFQVLGITHKIMTICIEFIGLLSPPTNIQLALQREGQLQFVRISWDQPFTLNITNRDNIIRYRVFVYFGGNSTRMYNTSMTEFTYRNHSANVLCNNDLLTTFQISAINQLGSSSKSNPVNLHSALCITSM